MVILLGSFPGLPTIALFPFSRWDLNSVYWLILVPNLDAHVKKRERISKVLIINKDFLHRQTDATLAQCLTKKPP